MECNKDEATRAKEIAEKKFLAKDILGAKKFALKAQNLFPGLEGIPQMLATLDVYISAENKINGDVDWYGILGADQKADEDTVRKKFRKLALMLHPDKNKSVGAEGAFKIVSEAWSLLSDKAKRVAYDLKRNAKQFQKASTMNRASSASPNVNGFYNFKKATTSSTRTQKSTTQAGHSSTPASHKSKPKTFWTVCHGCKMQYEYLRIYLNHNLLCPNCHQAFFAEETVAPPSNATKSSTPWNVSQKRHNLNNQTVNNNTFNKGKTSAAASNAGAGGISGSDQYNQNNFQWNPFSRTAGASTAAQAATVVQQAYEKVKREREEAQAAKKREEVLRRKQHSSRKGSGASCIGQPNVGYRRGVGDVSAGSHRLDTSNQMDEKAGGAYVSGLHNFGMERMGGITKLSITRDISQADIQNMLMEKAKKGIYKKLNELSSAAIARPPASKEYNENEKVAKTFRNDLRDKGNKSDKSESGEHGKKLPGMSGKYIDPKALSINVPDPDFHDFDKDRTEKSFGDNQVWAAYDDDDGMPRYYAMIHGIVSLNPFKVRISWLNSKTNSELGPLNWVASGFSKTCGDFRVGRYEINESLNSFSHKVRWLKGARGAIHIYPKKGDVWALYRNWSPDWNELTADEVIHKYDMVEVLEDYDELGVTVTPLVKVAGFKTVFHRHLDPREVRRIPKEEMFRFSHNVPSYLLTGQEASSAPKGCRELDPAATPFELLQVIEDVNEDDVLLKEDVVEDDVLLKEDVVEDVQKFKEDNVVEDVQKFKEDIVVEDVQKSIDTEMAENSSMFGK